MSNKLVRATARVLIAGCLVAATVVLGAGTSSADTAPPPPPPNSGIQNGNQSNGNSWIYG
jgi:hypothetical protein